MSVSRATALALAKSLYVDYQTADFQYLFRSGQKPHQPDYCYRHGWIILCGHSFNHEDLTGLSYHCAVQEAFAYL